MEDVKNKIRRIVKDYEVMFPEEYAKFKIGISEKVKLQKSKFGDMTKQSDMLIRPLFEVPETLYDMMKNRLTDAEFRFLYPEPSRHPDNKGPRWFAKEFKPYRTVEKV